MASFVFFLDELKLFRILQHYENNSAFFFFAGFVKYFISHMPLCFIPGTEAGDNPLG